MKPLKQKVVWCKKAEGEIKLRGRDPRLPYYIVISVGNLDGSIEPDDSEGCEGVTDTEEEAIEVARNVQDTYPSLECFIYHVTPIAKCWRGETKVTRLDKKKSVGRQGSRKRLISA